MMTAVDSKWENRPFSFCPLMALWIGNPSNCDCALKSQPKWAWSLKMIATGMQKPWFIIKLEIQTSNETYLTDLTILNVSDEKYKVTYLLHRKLPICNGSHDFYTSVDQHCQFQDLSLIWHSQIFSKELSKHWNTNILHWNECKNNHRNYHNSFA